MVEILTGDAVAKGRIKKCFLSYSVFQAWLDCPALFWFAYVGKVDGYKSASLAFGASWDAGVNEIAEALIAGRPAEAERAFAKTFASEFSAVEWQTKDVFTPAEARQWVEAGSPAELRRAAELAEKQWLLDFGRSRLAEYGRTIAPTLRPLRAQHRFFIDFGEAAPFGFKGTVDRIEASGAIVDNKTSASRWSAGDVAYDLQCVGYALAYRLEFGRPESHVQYDVLVKTRTQSFAQQFQQLPIIVEPAKFDVLLQGLTDVFGLMREGRLHRRTHGFSGRCGYCEHVEACWKPSHIWSRPPSSDEIDAWLADEPGNEALLERWVLQERSRARLVNWSEVGEQMKAMFDASPDSFQWWY